MSNLTSQSSLLNLAPKAAGVQTSSSKGEFYASDESAPSFLASLVQALDETGELLPQNLQIAEKELMQEFALKQNAFFGELSEEQKGFVFDSLSFMQVLGVLEELQIQNSEVKLANLSTQAQQFVQTQSNLDALKGAKNLSELLQIAKNLNLEVSNIKIDTIVEFKSAFPNLNKANFFNTPNQSVFKEFLNTKITDIIKSNESKFSAQSAKHKTQSTTNLLSKALQTLANDDDSDTLLKNELKNAVQKSLETLVEGDELNLKNQKSLQTADKTSEKPIILDEKASKIQLNNEKQEVLSTQPKVSIMQEKPAQTSQTPKEQAFEELIKNAVPNNEKQQAKTNAEQIKTLTPSSTEQTNAQNKVVSSAGAGEILSENVKNKALKKELEKNEKENKVAGKESVPKELKSAQSEKIAPNLNEKQPLNATNKASVDEKFAKQNEPKAEFDTKAQPQSTAKTKEPNLSAQSKNTPAQESAGKEFKAELNAPKESTTLPNTDSKANGANFESVMSKAQNKFSDLNANLSNASNQNASQSENKGFASGQNSVENEVGFNFGEDNSELNSLIKDLSQVSRSELKSEVNIKETFNRFAQDFKEQMQNYKSPITRFNITLNPSNLGEVEVTLIQRGSNLHINFNSSTNTMNLFIQNQAEFKNSLVNMGFTGLEMNFSDQSKKDKQQQGKNRSGYGFKDELNTNENNTNLEIILARYF